MANLRAGGAVHGVGMAKVSACVNTFVVFNLEGCFYVLATKLQCGCGSQLVHVVGK